MSNNQDCYCWDTLLRSKYRPYVVNARKVSHTPPRFPPPRKGSFPSFVEDSGRTASPRLQLGASLNFIYKKVYFESAGALKVFNLSKSVARCVARPLDLISDTKQKIRILTYIP